MIGLRSLSHGRHRYMRLVFVCAFVGLVLPTSAVRTGRGASSDAMTSQRLPWTHTELPDQDSDVFGVSVSPSGAALLAVTKPTRNGSAFGLVRAAVRAEGSSAWRLIDLSPPQPGERYGDRWNPIPIQTAAFSDRLLAVWGQAASGGPRLASALFDLHGRLIHHQFISRPGVPAYPLLMLVPLASGSVGIVWTETSLVRGALCPYVSSSCPIRVFARVMARSGGMTPPHRLVSLRGPANGGIWSLTATPGVGNSFAVALSPLGTPGLSTYVAIHTTTGGWTAARVFPSPIGATPTVASTGDGTFLVAWQSSSSSLSLSEHSADGGAWGADYDLTGAPGASQYYRLWEGQGSSALLTWCVRGHGAFAAIRRGVSTWSAPHSIGACHATEEGFVAFGSQSFIGWWITSIKGRLHVGRVGIDGVTSQAVLGQPAIGAGAVVPPSAIFYRDATGTVRLLTNLEAKGIVSVNLGLPTPRVTRLGCCSRARTLVVAAAGRFLIAVYESNPTPSTVKVEIAGQG
jgi:hypothetical protein